MLWMAALEQTNSQSLIVIAVKMKCIIPFVVVIISYDFYY